jgi:outer membrane protein OmpA-like peptidoglycan-associated protein/tetratricopeptide (TPR) repeat protein
VKDIKMTVFLVLCAFACNSLLAEVPYHPSLRVVGISVKRSAPSKLKNDKRQTKELSMTTHQFNNRLLVEKKSTYSDQQVLLSNHPASDSLITRGISGKALKRLGKNALIQNDPASAIVFFEAYLKNNKKDAVAKFLLGQAFLRLRDYELAQRLFLDCYKTNKEKVPEALYFLAQMQKVNGFYDSAKVNFEKFKKEYKGDEKLLKKNAAREIVLCDSVQKLGANENKIIIRHLDTTINKLNTEGAPITYDDSTLIFTSLRTDKKLYVTDENTGTTVYRNLYVATRKNNQWQFKGEYSSVLNDANSNTGNASFSPDRKRIYFTRCKPNLNEEMNCAIYVSEKNGDVWSEPVKLPKTINNTRYTSTMPAVTNDPAKGNDVIYYVSDKKGGKGGLDIWYTTYDKKNKVYKTPKNAGVKINSSGDEMSPYFDGETRTLYYSSDGVGGLGGFDVFKATGDGKKWLSVENVGQPINTGADDMFYSISTNREEGFFVSNRKWPEASKNNTCCDDIYFYKRSEYIKINLTGTIAEFPDSNVFTPNAFVDVYLKDKKTKDKILVKTVKTDSLGRYATSVEPDKDYLLIVRREDLLNSSIDIDTRGITRSQLVSKNVIVVKKPKGSIRIPNIQYAFGKSEMTESSKLSLDSTVLRLMVTNPDLIIEIQSHTDNKGSDVFNLKLSQKRAESVVKYLESKGISAKRLKAKGYGESSPIAANENPDGSDNPDGRTLNRRTDFKIIGDLPDELIDGGEKDSD